MNSFSFVIEDNLAGKAPLEKLLSWLLGGLFLAGFFILLLPEPEVGFSIEQALGVGIGSFLLIAVLAFYKYLRER